MHSIKEKLPGRQEITPVYSIILFITFTSMLFLVFWVLPSWLGDTDLMRILTMTAYVLFYALLESAVVLFGIILLAILLPDRYFKDNFVAQGSGLVVLISIGAYFLQKNISRVHPLIHKHGSDARCCIPVHNGPVYGCRATVIGEQ